MSAFTTPGAHEFRRLIVAVLILAQLASAACGRRSEEPATSAHDPIPVESGGMPAFIPHDDLRLRGARDLVLAEGGHGIRLTLAEYNARVSEYPVSADIDLREARVWLLEKLVDHKTIAAEGRLRGGAVGRFAGLKAEEEALAQRVIQDNVQRSHLIPRDEALAYLAEHPELLPAEGSGEPDEGEILHIRFVMQNQRFAAGVARWREREKVSVYYDRFEALKPLLEPVDTKGSKSP